MSEALKRMGLPLEGIHHRGGDDAWNIAAILSRVLRSSRVDESHPVSRDQGTSKIFSSNPPDLLPALQRDAAYG